MMRFKASHKGIVIPTAVIVGACILMTLVAAYQYLRTSSKHHQVILEKEKTINIADSGVGQAITLLRLNPEVIPRDEEFHAIEHPQGLVNSLGTTRTGVTNPIEIKDEYDETIGEYYAMARRVVHGVFNDTGIPREVFHLVTVSWLPATTPEDRADLENYRKFKAQKTQVHSFLEISQVNSYFAAIRGMVTVSPGANLNQGLVYGNEVVFADARVETKLGGIHYYVTEGLSPSAAALTTTPEFNVQLYNNSTKAHEKIDYTNPLIRPVQLKAPLIFPGMIEERNFYQQYTLRTPPTADDNKCEFGPTSKTSPLMPPNMLPGGFEKEDHYYFCNEDSGVTITGPLHVAGQVIIISRAKIKIDGDIQILDPEETSSSGWAGLGANDDSTAHQLVLFSEGGIELAPTWCLGAKSMIESSGGDANKLTLDGVFAIASLSTITLEESGDCPDNEDYSLFFRGAMTLSINPRFGEYFKANRDYEYLDSLRTHPPPLRLIYEREKEFETRAAKYEIPCVDCAND